jgi:hypothetical protein
VNVIPTAATTMSTSTAMPRYFAIFLTELSNGFGEGHYVIRGPEGPLFHKHDTVLSRCTRP